VITDLAIPYADVSAASLTFRPDAPALPVLDALERDAGPLRLSLRLLGASHQAVVATPDGLLAETLAYRDGLPADLPETFTQRIGAWRHRYTCEVDHVGVPELRARIRALHGRGSESDLLIGVFGGEPDAVTALEIVDTAPLRWRTVHTYPQHGEIVTTVGEVATADPPPT
jgi:hypothetical protein